MSAVTANAVAAMPGPPPSSTATAAACPAQPEGRHPARVGVPGRHGLGERPPRPVHGQPSRSTRATMRVTAASRVRSVVR